MGFLDKVKAAKNFVTGGGAQLSVQVGQAVPGAPVPVMVSAQVGGAALSVNQVYVRVRGEEQIQMTVRDRDDGGRDRINERTESFDQTFPISGPLQLEANSQHQWQGQFQLPPNVPPSYVGPKCKHTWSVMAALDIRGNDPDSGWVEFHLR